MDTNVDRTATPRRVGQARFGRRPTMFRLRTVGTFAIAAVLTYFAGCTGSNEPGSQTDTEPPAPAETSNESATPAAAGNVTISPITPDELAQLLEKHKTAGKVVLLDCWATWCVPCRKGFPHTVALSRDHAGDGLEVISLAFESDPDAPEKALEFLQEQNATFANYVSALGDEQSAFDAFNVTSVPHYRVYGRDGTLLKTFSQDDPNQSFDHTDIEAAVKDALAAR